ncbi:MAG TPA: hypothetical protein VK875_04440 [Euzebyales bacterium]|nr:hypothetical protein [Euzebyales bacterium]
MRRRQPRDQRAVVDRLRATLDRRAGDISTTPAFSERVQRLRRRRRRTATVTRSLAFAAVVVLAALTIVDALRPEARLDLVSPPPVAPSPSASPVAPSPVPSAPPSETGRPVEPAPVPSEPAGVAPPDEEEPSEPPGEPTAAPDPAPPTLLHLDGDPRSAFACEQDATTVFAMLDLPETETGYTIDLREPATMTVAGEGFSDVSDAVQITRAGQQTIYTATFASDADDFELSEIRLEAPADLPPC